MAGDDLDAVADALGAVLPADALVRNAPSSGFTTYRVGGAFGLLVRVARVEDLPAVRDRIRDLRPRVVVLGRGSNMLVADSGFPGVALMLEGEFEALDVGRRIVTAGAAVPLPVLARRAAATGAAGLEFYVGIPGTVGGAVRMNAGGHGRETAAVLQRAWILDLFGTQPVQARARDALELGFRHSNLRRSELVVGADFHVIPDEAAACEARVAEIVRWRREHQPGGANAGSVFVNPEGDSAGRLIDAAGLKGRRLGGAVVSEKHANFIQAEPGATASDVYGLLQQVRAEVAAHFGVTLHPEVQLLGFATRDDRGS